MGVIKLRDLSLLLLISCPTYGQDQPTLREKTLSDAISRLEARVALLESRQGEQKSPDPVTSALIPKTDPAIPRTVNSPASAPLPDALAGTTLSGSFDGYYQYNFNRPIGRDNQLRAYDVSSNSFSLNQASVIVENAPDPAKNKRWGARLDLQFGQATQTLQGNPANEPRPEIYRNIFQAYGTYVLPLGKGFTVDFGKWSSSLGLEGNYTKDQINYSRSFLFNFLPFYHMGVRANYKVNDTVSVNYWLTNGTQQTEAFNNFKDELVGISLTPRNNITWIVNYYLGQEHPDVTFYNGATLNSPPPATNLPTLQGVPFAPIPDAPTGHLHVLDSYVTWQASPKLTLALEGDYVIQRFLHDSAPAHTQGIAAYARYQLTPRFAIAARSEYLSDRGGLFGGTSQALKESTVTLEHKVAEGLVVREEWRRDWSNQAYFLTDRLGVLKKEQNTATVGLVWWFGQKTGSW